MNKMIVLNVGLWVGGVRPSSDVLYDRVAEASRFCLSHFGDADYQGVHLEAHAATDDGSREDTLVVVFEATSDWRQLVHELAVHMRQECIACWIVYQDLPPRGTLIGPNPRPWEPFDRTYFIHPKGKQ